MRAWTRVLGERDHYAFVVDFLRQRGLSRAARLTMTAVAALSAMVAWSVLIARWHYSAPSMLIGLPAALGATAVAAFWSVRWPTRTQSAALTTAGVLALAAWSLTLDNMLLATLACTALAVTGGYIALLHGGRMLAFNFVVAGLLTAVTAVRLAREIGPATAFAAFWIIVLVNVAAPTAVRGLSRAMSSYAEQSDRDPLTGLLNRRGFIHAVEARMFDDLGDGKYLSLLVIDIDRFKALNDAHGHATGDRALQGIADSLRAHAPDTAAICRSGGEEFIVAATGTSRDVLAAAERVRAAIAEMPENITASVGTAVAEIKAGRIRNPTKLVERLIRSADSAMYVAKRNGGNRTQEGVSLVAL